MPLGRPNRCPSCGKLSDVVLLKFSAAHGGFVCPSCRRSGNESIQAPAGEAALDPPPAPEPPRSDQGNEIEPKDWRAWLIPAGSLVVGIVCIIIAAIVLIGRAGSAGKDASSEQRAWETAHRDQIIAIKSAAEALAIQGKLPEAHEKYRDLEKLLAGRTMKDAQLAALVAQARRDQDRIYSLILQQSAPRQAAGNAPAPASNAHRLAPASAPSPEAGKPPSSSRVGEIF